MVAEKEEKVVDRAEDSLTTDKKAAVVEEEAQDSGDKVYIQYLNINSDATTVKVDNTPYWLKALKVLIAFAVLWGFDAAVYALVIVLTIETGTTILYVYFGLFVVLASLLTFFVLYGMRVREVEAEQEARKMRQESGIVEAPRMRSLGAGRGVRPGAVAVSVGRSEALPARAASKVQFASE